jgi:hypothetical protein
MWEWAFLLLQPYPFLTDSSFTTSNAYSDDPIQYPINDILAILSFTKVYILVRTALFLTPYMNNRCTQAATQPTDSAKCMAAEQTILTP